MIRPRRALLLAALGALLAAAALNNANAKADPGLDQYTIVNAPAVCILLAQTPTVAGVEDVIATLQQKGLTAEQSGEVVARAAIGWCPSQLPEVQAFAKFPNSGKEMA